ncbi:MAG: N-acetylneuraminate synthase [Spirochaetia bacterium]|jgi:N-acetylneuraminate synthase|nr:N-acetylneuraminate synthase [Spirochaetia bacterium]
MGVFIIAEAGVNHNGKLDLAVELCDAAKKAGADAVKFQTFKTENILTKTATMAEYQEKNLGGGDSQFAMVKALELKFSDFEILQLHCQAIGILFLSTPDDRESLDFLTDRLKLPMIKVGSGEVTNIPYLRAIGSKHLPVTLSTGMATIGEVERAIKELSDSGSGEISLLHCTTNYPCPMGEVNLNAMRTLQKAFGLKTGYSDHTLGIEIPIAAATLGAEIIEKHFTLDRNMEGPDHKASLEPSELAAMVQAIRNIELALGDGIKRPNRSEEKIKPAVRRSIVAAKRIEKGEIFTSENLVVKRAGGKGIPSELWDLVVGRKAKGNYEADEVIEW